MTWQMYIYIPCKPEIQISICASQERAPAQIDHTIVVFTLLLHHNSQASVDPNDGNRYTLTSPLRCRLLLNSKLIYSLVSSRQLLTQNHIRNGEGYVVHSTYVEGMKNI